jgi:signal transduction histidine kinase
MKRLKSARFADLPLVWKLMLPYFFLVMAVGAAGTLLLSRQAANQAQGAINSQLTQRVLQYRAGFHDRELYLLEAGNFAANVDGMITAVQARDAVSAQRLLASVVALKPDLSLAAVVDPQAHTIAALSREHQGTFATGAFDAQPGLVTWALGSASGGGVSAVVKSGGHPFLATATPVCRQAAPCDPAGVALVAVEMRELHSLVSMASPVEPHDGVALLDAAGGVLVTSGTTAANLGLPTGLEGGQLRRVDSRGRGRSVATAYAPILLNGRRAAVVAMSVPLDPVDRAVEGATLRLLALLVLALLGIGGIGFGLARMILGQVRPLVRTSRALASGSMSARVAIVGSDELGELAAAVNNMAERLEETYATLEQKVEERTHQVRDLLADRNQFFTSLSHELRTPLAVIAGQAEQIRRKNVDPEVGQSADMVQASAGQVLSVVNQILDLAKAEAGKLVVELEPVQLHALFNELRPTIEVLGAAAGVGTVARAPRNLWVRADPIRLSQVILNLVENAVKYTPSGGRVAVSATAASDRVRIAVSDSGVGIPPGLEERIFEPFYRAEGVRTQHGEPSSGLGLPLVRRLTELQEGTVSLSSRQGEGTTFVVSLPAAQAPGYRSRGSAAANAERTPLNVEPTASITG